MAETRVLGQITDQERDEIENNANNISDLEYDIHILTMDLHAKMKQATLLFRSIMKTHNITDDNPTINNETIDIFVTE